MRLRTRNIHRGALASVVLFSNLSAFTAQGQTNPIPVGTQKIRLAPFATIPSADGPPQDLVSANDGTGRLFATTRNGKLRVLNPSGIFLDSSANPYFSLTTNGVSLYLGGEGGFSGIAFSPTFATDRKFFTVNTDTYNASNAANFSHPEIAPNTPGVTPANHIVLREWTASSATATNPTFTSSVLLRINHPQNNHQGGALKFGPDGNLYLSLGDGGGGDDNSGGATSTTDGHTNATGNGQDINNVFGKILRVRPTYTGGYTVPSDNPFAGAIAGVDEIYAYGLRNPYRMSFDRSTGKLYAGDVGQGQREEVDVITNGTNYGWPFREGTRNNEGGNGSGRTAPGGFTSVAPIAEYTHSDGDSIIGGFVYRGASVPALQGKYVFGDYQGNTGGNGIGRLFYTDANGGPIQSFLFDTTGGGVAPTVPLYGFGEGDGGELYALFVNGQIVHIVPEPTTAVLVWAGVTLTMRRRR